MIRFVQNVREWLDSDKDNVIAVHCKGGKGRTGTMICIWLVEAGLFGSAEVCYIILFICYFKALLF